MSDITDQIVEQAQVFARASVAFDRDGLQSSDDSRQEAGEDLRDLIATALADARREGAEAMRSGFVARMRDQRPVAWIRYQSDGGIQGPLLDAQVDGARRECWTPLIAADWVDRSMTPGERQAVLLTDEQILTVRKETKPLPQSWGETFALSRAIEAAVLAANNLEVRRG